MTNYAMTRDIVIQLLGDPGFYAACPLFLELQASATIAFKRYMESFSTTCEGCGNREIMSPSIVGFAKACRDALAADPKALQPLLDYLRVKLRQPKLQRASFLCRLGGKVLKISF